MCSKNERALGNAERPFEFKSVYDHKPDPVLHPKAKPRHLSTPGITARDLSAYPPVYKRATCRPISEETSTTGIRGISIRKVYLPRILLPDGVRSYRTFSPLSHPPKPVA